MAEERDLSFHRKYRPNTMAKYVGNERLKETAMKALSCGKRPQVILLYGDSGCGKAQPLDSLVLTTSGYKKMGDIKIGDEVFTDKGSRGRVSGIYPQGVRPIYRITLSDRTYIDVSDEHLNCVYYIEDDKRTDLVVNTLELIDLYNSGSYNLYMNTPSVDWGNSVEDTTRFDINGISNDLLFSNKDTRLSLLNNLFNYYGVVVDGKVELNFNTIHGKKLSDDVSFLVRSLGIVDIETETVARYTHRLESKIFEYNGTLIFDDNLCYTRYIKSIERIEDQECQCIMVDHPDHTYISDFFIPTHNTTFARLLAKEYSCENRSDTLGACNGCMTCEVINEYITTGRTDILTNIQEIDITDQSGKRDLNAVFEDMMIPAFGDEWKVYIFDECHKASDALQNRLLKITEEPPEHVLMIFCTTEPDKIIETLRNRCQLQLQVKKPKVKELAGLLRYVCECEGVEYDNKGLEFIANRGELTIRTALQNLQQIVNEQNSAKYESAIKVFEEISNTLIIEFFKALKKKDVFRYITLLHEIKSKMDLVPFLNELRDFIKRGIYTINGINQDGIADAELSIYRDLFGDLGVAQICNLLNKILNINMSNVELELIDLGYTGLCVERTSEISDTMIVPKIENELAKEIKNTSQVLKEKEEQSYNQGVENASKQMQSISVEDLLGLGGSLVE